MDNNRFEKLNWFSRSALVFFSMLLVIVFLEMGAFAFSYFLHITRISSGGTFMEYKDNFHPIFTRVLLKQKTSKAINDEASRWNEYDPWYGWRNSFTGKRTIYATDKSGFICNGDINRDVYSKGKDVFRIFILGGSTVAGHGVTEPSKSISAQTEKYLNSTKPKNINYHFEVINAGVAGYYSSMELAYLEFEILFYKPDMIIVFDSYNDFFQKNIVEQTDNSYPERYHWNERHVELKADAENPKFKIQLPERYQIWRYSYFLDMAITYSDKLFVKLQSALPRPKVKIPDIIINKYPSTTEEEFHPIVKWRSNLNYDKWLTEKQIESLPNAVNKHNLDHYITNIVFMKAITEKKNVFFLSILQPMLLPELKKVFTPAEKMLYDCNIQFAAQQYHVDYHKMIFDSSEYAAKQIGNELHDSFLDMRGFFNGEARRTYFDWNHYNDFGNQLIGQYLSDFIINKLEKTSS